MAEPLTARQRACLVSVANIDTLGLSLQQACRAALDRIDHLEAVKADLCTACEAVVARIGELTDSGIWGPRSWTEELVAPLHAVLAKARGEVAS